MKRLFFALWPDDQTRQNCLQVMNKLPVSQEQLVDVLNLHVTLVFVGGVNSSTEEALLRIGSELTFSEMSIYFDQLSYWQKPEILCLSGHSLNNALPCLVEQLIKQVKQLPIMLDERPYQAHITLARKAKQTVYVEFEPILWQSNSFCLVESQSSPQGVHYEVLCTWPV